MDQGRAIASSNWPGIEGFPHRVPIRVDPANYIMNTAEPWLIKRFGNRDHDGKESAHLRHDNPHWRILDLGIWLVFAFKDKTDAAMFRLLFGQDW